MSLRLGNTIVAGAISDTSAFATKTELAGKVDTSDLAECAVVIESKRPTASDPTWYRKYSDGWVEQGGSMGASSGTNVNVNLLKTMNNSNYFIYITPKTTTGSAETGTFNYTTTSFTANIYGGGTSGFCWEVKGYAAE